MSAVESMIRTHGNRVRLASAFLLGLLLLAIALPRLSVRSLAAPKKHRYVIMVTRTRDSYFKDNMDEDFFNELKRFKETKNFEITKSKKPWGDQETCKNDPKCEQIVIDTETRELLFECTRYGRDRMSGPHCNATERDMRDICIVPLPRDHTISLWNHSKFAHPGEDE
jgi:hypothetical protein